MSSSFQFEIENVLGLFNSIKFTQPPSITILATTIEAINGNIRGDYVKERLVDNIPAEDFVV